MRLLLRCERLLTTSIADDYVSLRRRGTRPGGRRARPLVVASNRASRSRPGWSAAVRRPAHVRRRRLGAGGRALGGPLAALTAPGGPARLRADRGCRAASPGEAPLAPAHPWAEHRRTGRLPCAPVPGRARLPGSARRRL